MSIYFGAHEHCADVSVAVSESEPKTTMKRSAFLILMRNGPISCDH